MKIDHRLSLALSRFARQRRSLRLLSIFCGSWIIWFLALAAFAVGFTSFRRLQYLVGVLVVGTAINLLLGKIRKRKRPFDTHAYEALISTWWLGGSFPSDHAMLATVFGSLICSLGHPWYMVSIVAVTLVALGRVLVGVHYVSDVVAGVLVGLTAALIVIQFVPILV